MSSAVTARVRWFRRFMGAALHDLRSHERWIVLDMILEQPPRGVPEAADETGRVVDAIQYCDPARPTTFVPMPGKRHRWEFMLMPGDDPATVTKPDRIYEMLKPWSIDPATSVIERAVVYTFHSALSTAGGAIVCCSLAMPRTKCRHFSVRAWARDFVMPPILRGSSTL
jgi:hypothetical protein